jgi:hypothetical protein
MMETLRSSSPGAATAERGPGLALEAGLEPSHEESQAVMESPPSTIPLDEPLFRDAEHAESVIVLDDDNDPAVAPSSRPRRANITRLDYSYPDYEQLMKGAAARNPSRKRKRQKSDISSDEVVLVRSFCILQKFFRVDTS